MRETKIKVTTKNKNGFAAVDHLNEDGEDFLLLFFSLMCDSSPNEMGNFEILVIDEFKNPKKQIQKFHSRVSPNEEFEIQLEALQSEKHNNRLSQVLLHQLLFSSTVIFVSNLIAIIL